MRIPRALSIYAILSIVIALFPQVTSGQDREVRIAIVPLGLPEFMRGELLAQRGDLTTTLEQYNRDVDTFRAKCSAVRSDDTALINQCRYEQGNLATRLDRLARAADEFRANVSAVYRRFVNIPSGVNGYRLNDGYTSPTQQFMLDLLGKPGELPATQMSAGWCGQWNPGFAKLLVTADIGPFRVTALNPVVAALSRILAKVKTEHPNLYAQLSNGGTGCVRPVRNHTPLAYSNHSWGAAIDVQVAFHHIDLGSSTTQVAQLALYPYFHAEGFYWGAGFSTPGHRDPEHFEASTELLRQWSRDGLLQP